MPSEHAGGTTPSSASDVIGAAAAPATTPLMTSEVRWFQRGSLPEAVRTTFLATVPAAVVEPPRTDAYVRLSAHDLGIKLREGRLEVKGRLEDHGLHHLCQGIELEAGVDLVGRVETWAKWTVADFNSDTDLPSARLVRSPGPSARVNDTALHLTSVTKARIVAYLDPIRGAFCPLPAEVDAQWWRDRCAVEITEVRRAGDDWWTLAVEAPLDAGRPTTVLNTALTAVTRAVPSAISLLSPCKDNSRSYPAWLAERQSNR